MPYTFGSSNTLSRNICWAFPSVLQTYADTAAIPTCRVCYFHNHVPDGLLRLDDSPSILAVQLVRVELLLVKLFAPFQENERSSCSVQNRGLIRSGMGQIEMGTRIRWPDGVRTTILSLGPWQRRVRRKFSRKKHDMRPYFVGQMLQRANAKRVPGSGHLLPRLAKNCECCISERKTE